MISSPRVKNVLPLLENCLQDVRYALHVLWKYPAFTVTALVTLMLGIGANLVVFSVVNALLLQPMEVSDPEQLYQIRHQSRLSGAILTTSYPAFEDFPARNTTFSGLAAIYGYSEATLNWNNTFIKIHGYEATSNYFDLLGVRPALGRFFHEADEHGPNSAPYVVLSDALWRSVFHADLQIVGQSVKLNAHSFTIIAVASARFHGTERLEWPEYWIPMANEEQLSGRDYLHSRTQTAVMMIGRLKLGVTPQRATEELNAVAAALAREYPQTDKGVSFRLIRPGLFGDDGEAIGKFLTSVMFLAFLLLAAACANLANLFAARAADRSREAALSIALGARSLAQS